jgi:hypothetical protein
MRSSRRGRSLITLSDCRANCGHRNAFEVLPQATRLPPQFFPFFCRGSRAGCVCFGSPRRRHACHYSFLPFSVEAAVPAAFAFGSSPEATRLPLQFCRVRPPERATSAPIDLRRSARQESPWHQMPGHGCRVEAISKCRRRFEPLQRNKIAPDRPWCANRTP